MRDANRLRRLVGSGPAPAGVASLATRPGGVGYRPGALRPPAGSRLTTRPLVPPSKARPDADKTPDGAPKGAARSEMIARRTDTSRPLGAPSPSLC